MGIHVSMNCPHCGKFNFIDTIEPFLRNRCRHCKDVLDENIEKGNLEEIIQIGFKEKVPEHIPEICSGCKYFKEGFIYTNKGRCNLYYLDTFMSSTCIVTKVDDMLEELGRKISPVCPKCDTELENIKASFCRECGAEIYPKEYIKVANCDKCSENYHVDTKFCEIDGNKLKIIELEKDSRINKKVPKEKTIEKEDDVDLKYDVTENNKSELGFGLGNIWIVLCLIQSLSFLFLFKKNNFLPFLFISIFAFLSSIGLVKRKLWGLYITYFSIFINYFIGAAIVFTLGKELNIGMSYSIYAFPLIIVGWLWFNYFKNRKEMFSS